MRAARFLTVTFLVVALLLCMPGLATANIISLFETQFDTDWTYAGVGGVRGGDGNADITLAGISGTVNQAYLYWHGPSNDTDPDSNGSIMFDGNPITGTNIGEADDNCWGFVMSHAYRADVTALVSGNGAYTVSGFGVDGNVANGDETNGFSLVAFFDDGNDTNNVDVVAFDGNDSTISSAFDPGGWDATLAGINYTAGSASVVMGVADGQGFNDGDVEVNTTVVAAGPLVFQGTTVPDDGSANSTNGGLWDIREFDITALLSPGPNVLNITSSHVSDCLGLIHTHIVLPAGAAPPPPSSDIPEPSTYALFALGALGVMVWRRKRSA